MIEQLREMINQARLKCSAPNSVPAISHVMLGRPFQRKLARIRGLRTHLLSLALATEIRRYLKNDTDEGDGVTRDQLEFWPATLRPLIKEIDRARVFVPSRGEFVMLDPTAISASEVKEAGDYLISKGEDCIRIGGALNRLASRMPK